MQGEKRGYRSYLLRLWQVGNGEERVWRISLESPHTGKRWSFTDLAALLAFLEQECTGKPPTAPPQTVPPAPGLPARSAGTQ